MSNIKSSRDLWAGWKSMVAWKLPRWEYLHHRNWQTLQITNLRDSVWICFWYIFSSIHLLYSLKKIYIPWKWISIYCYGRKEVNKFSKPWSECLWWKTSFSVLNWQAKQLTAYWPYYTSWMKNEWQQQKIQLRRLEIKVQG